MHTIRDSQITPPHERPERRRREASAYLNTRWGLSYVPTTLTRLASTGGGPLYFMRGRFAFYREEDLDAWAQSKISGPKRKASDGVEAGSVTERPTERAPINFEASGRASPAVGNPLNVLDALAIELGKLAAERDYAKIATEDKPDPDGLFSPPGESVS